MTRLARHYQFELALAALLLLAIIASLPGCAGNSELVKAAKPRSIDQALILQQKQCTAARRSATVLQAGGVITPAQNLELQGHMDTCRAVVQATRSTLDALTCSTDPAAPPEQACTPLQLDPVYRGLSTANAALLAAAAILGAKK